MKIKWEKSKQKIGGDMEQHWLRVWKKQLQQKYVSKIPMMS